MSYYYGLLLGLFIMSSVSAADLPIWFQSHASVANIERALQQDASAIEKRNDLGQTGLIFAVTMGRFSDDYSARDKEGLVELLVRYGADVNAPSLSSPREEDHSSGNTPLHYVAIQTNYNQTIPLLNYLIDQGADINLKNSLGETPLMWTANLALIDDKTHVFQEFVTDLADVNLQNNIGDTFLHILIKNKDFTMVQRVMKQFGSMFDLSLKNSEGWTVFDLAKKTLEPDSLRALETFKPIGLHDDVKAVDMLGRTGLMLAIIRNDLPFAQRQIEKQSNINAQDTTRFKHAPLHFAVIKQYNVIPFVKLLLDNKADPNIKTRYGATPLHYLLKFNRNSPDRSEVAQMLIKAGADPFIKNNKGKSVYDWAQKKDPAFAKNLKLWFEEAKMKRSAAG